jgi:capsular exopolysaccharide synthesis family protein
MCTVAEGSTLTLPLVDLLGHLAIFRANWWRILIVAAIVGGASYAFSASHPKVYAADQLMSVASQDPSTGRGETQIALRVQFYAAVGNARLIASAVRSKQHLTALSVDQVQSRIFVFETASTGILEVTATGRTPGEAATIAAGVSAALSDFVTKEQTDATNAQRSELEAQVNALQNMQSTAAVRNDPILAAFVQQEVTRLRRTLLTLRVSGFQVTPLTPPVIRPGPISPHPKKAGMLGFLVTVILVGEGAVMTRGFKDRFARTNDVEQITNLTGLPVLAMVPHGRGPDVVEAFRTLRTNLMFLEGADRPRTIAIVSPNPGAGKSFCAAHLAESAVAVDAIVVLVDADLRRPVLHSRLRCDREPGLSNALRGSELRSTLQSVPGIPNLKLIPSGSVVNDAVGVLGGRAFRHVLDSLEFADVVIVDTPPGSVYADALAVAAQCDATLLVLDAKSTRRRAARTLIDSLERTGATLIGVVVNNAQVDVRNTYEGQYRGRLRLR